MLATRHGYNEVVKALIDAGANVNIRNKVSLLVLFIIMNIIPFDLYMYRILSQP